MNLKNNYLLIKLLKWAYKKIENFNIYRPAIKENTTRVIVTCQNNIYYYGMWF